jgi:hypothetical protein
MPREVRKELAGFTIFEGLAIFYKEKRMKRDVLLRKVRLALIPFVIALVAFFVIRTISSQRTACALDSKAERASISSPNPDGKTKGSSKQDGSANASGQSATLAEITSLPLQNAQPSTGSRLGMGDSQERQAESAKDKNEQDQPNCAPGNQDTAPQIQDVGQVDTPTVIPSQEQSRILVKFKTGITKEQIDTINAGNHTKIIQSTPAQTVVNNYNRLAEVEFAELDRECGTPEPADSIQPLQ